MDTLLSIAFIVCFCALVFINQKNIDLKQQNEELRLPNDILGKQSITKRFISIPVNY